MQKLFYIKTYGCQMNFYDSDKIVDLLKPLGYQISDKPENCDLAILNTCHIREKASEKMYSDIGRLANFKKNQLASGKNMTIAICGCVAQAEGKEIIKRNSAVDIVVGPQNYHSLPKILNEKNESKKYIENIFPKESKFDFFPEPSFNGYTAFVSIQEGCDKFCTFCVVPYTRGGEDDGIVLNLDDLQWEQYFSGLGEDEAWRYKAATSHYQENQEDYEDEEFHYAIYNDETINKFKELAEIAGVEKWPGKDDAPIPEEEISNFLESILPTHAFDTIRQDYLWALGTAVSRARNAAIVELYDDEVNYPIVSCDAGGSYCIKIPYDSLMAIVKDRDLLNLSELKEAEVNDQIYLEDAYYDTFYDDEGREEIISEFNYVLGSTIDRFNEEGNDLKEIMGKIKNFNDTLKKIGLKNQGSHWRDGQLWKSEDGKLVLY